MRRKYDVITFISKYLYFILTRPGVANFADIIKSTKMLIKTTFKDLIKVKTKNRKNILERNLYPYFSIYRKLLISGEKTLIPAGFKGRVT